MVQFVDSLPPEPTKTKRSNKKWVPTYVDKECPICHETKNSKEFAYPWAAALTESAMPVDITFASCLSCYHLHWNDNV